MERHEQQGRTDVEIQDVLDYLDGPSKAACFEDIWKRLQNAQHSIDLKALRVCIRLLPSDKHDATSYTELAQLVKNSIPIEANRPDRLYGLAEVCLSNPPLAQHLFEDVMSFLHAINSALSQKLDEVQYGGVASPVEEEIPKAVAYLHFLKCSFWLPADHNHFVTPELVQFLSNRVGIAILDDAAYDALSALLSLLQRPVTILQPYGEEQKSYLSSGPELHVGQQLWTHFRELPDVYFSSDSSRVFRTWFQWVCYAEASGIDLEGIYEPLYWLRLRNGLMSGFAEQRKYCLGILRRSIILAQKDINTELMTMEVSLRSSYQQQYEQYISLFETIVLDRYANQVQARLPQLTSLFDRGSLISSAWMTTLLSAALHPKVQDGVRKLVGTWYIDFITKTGALFDRPDEEVCTFDEHIRFLVDGFLPWATQGPLFSSTLSSTRDHTTCAHGEALAGVISTFVMAVPMVFRPQILKGTLHFILHRGGKIFHHSIVYMLSGLLSGFRSQSNLVRLDLQDLEPMVATSRIPGLPEIASDLCATICAIFCTTFAPNDQLLEDIPGYDLLKLRYEAPNSSEVAFPPSNVTMKRTISPLSDNLPHLQSFLQQLRDTQHKSIEDDLVLLACDNVLEILDVNSTGTLEVSELYHVLEALWEETDRQAYRRPVTVRIPPLFFHPNCIRLCVSQQEKNEDANGPGLLTSLLSKVMESLRQLAEGRSYLLSVFVDSLRKACFAEPRILSILPFEEFFLRFIEKPPLPRKDFLFEVAAAEMMQQHLQHKTYASYYGKREWHAYAAVIDMLNRLPDDHLGVAKNVLDSLLEPWRTQKPPVPILSKWKETFQLQAILLLSDSYISASDAEWYLEAFMNMLVLEHWPRYRYLLEWIISRLYYRHPRLAERILPDLARLDDTAPIQIASLMKLAVLASPFLNSEPFALQLLIQLIPFSASQKVHIRHEAHWSFPIVFELAERKGWSSITGNPAFRALNSYIRNLNKSRAPFSTIRTLKLDAIEDFTLVNIFQGDYLTIETPERELVHYDDFIDLWAGDEPRVFDELHIRVPLGTRKSGLDGWTPLLQETGQLDTTTKSESATAPLQTKAGWDLSSLLPPTGPPSASLKRPTSVILIASLIDAPINLGGLSRISESFGLGALYINSLTHLSNKDFQSTAVTSHKHLPIHELKVDAVPAFIIDMKREGYEVVAIEQTDRSGILGEEKSMKAGGLEGVGTLPKKCVLVLGSEKGGVTSEVLAVVDRCVEIKTVGVTRSLNVQTAGGIAVYEWWREWGMQL